MNKKVIDLNEQRQRRKPRSLNDVAREAVAYYFDPARIAGIEEPKQFASGKTFPSGSFVPDGDDEIDDEDIHEKR